MTPIPRARWDDYRSMTQVVTTVGLVVNADYTTPGREVMTTVAERDASRAALPGGGSPC